MGLLDIINGMQNGPRGQSTPAPAGSGGMSPITIALMGLLAYKAIKHLSPGQPTGTTSPNATATCRRIRRRTWRSAFRRAWRFAARPIGWPARWRCGRKRFEWRAERSTQAISAERAERRRSILGRHRAEQRDFSRRFVKSAGEDRIKTLMAHSGMSRDELIAGLSQQLPELINQLTPNGRLPTEQEASRLI